MGTWGTAIFSDDLASDIKSEFRDKIGFGKASVEATAELISEHKDELANQEEAGVFWLALAATQWTLGRLQEKVKLKAIEIIESGTDLQRWSENEKDFKKRKVVLEKLKQQLLNPQPTQKKIAKPFIRKTKMETGDLVTYKHPNGNMAFLRVLDIQQDQCGDRYPQIEILDYFDSTLTQNITHETLNRKIIKGDSNDPFAKIMKPSGTYYLSSYGKRDIEPWDRLKVLQKKTKSLSGKEGTVSMIWWREFDNFLIELFEKE